ncbi:DUF6134 family protein [Cyclobacterium amurskyense]|uniref:Nicotinic acid mononucleotide adenyltransferase n=1 Tax=Cyclobacterium amurskyense TaxID=320787 RepID=A0A0H4PAM3_9BACT|nr:DUF6134 family protein [Cyclobacterium amurskyense]AKP51476.1 hypothetical protein CA2015_2051 [Cyclobacterium amurskyense]
MPRTGIYIACCFSMLLFLSTSALNAQDQIDFDITLAGFKIGDMEANKVLNGDTTLYLLESKVSFWLFGTINVDYNMKVKYLDGIFINSIVSSKTNRGDFVSKIWLEGDQYIIDAKGYKYENSDTINEPIHHSAVRLFFEEPKGVKLMMAENLGKYSEIRAHGEGIYTTHIEGDQNKYYYQNGQMLKVSMHNPIKNYEVRRRY